MRSRIASGSTVVQLIFPDLQISGLRLLAGVSSVASTAETPMRSTMAVNYLVAMRLRFRRNGAGFGEVSEMPAQRLGYTVVVVVVVVGFICAELSRVSHTSRSLNRHRHDLRLMSVARWSFGELTCRLLVLLSSKKALDKDVLRERRMRRAQYYACCMCGARSLLDTPCL